MRINRSHLSWLVFTLAATALATLLYVANFYPGVFHNRFPWPAFLGEAPPTRQASGATPLGLIFGALAFAIFLFASALGLRKKQRKYPIGEVRTWLKAHIWLTILTIPLVVFHCGFHVGGVHAQWLMALYVIVMASGFLGLAFQQFMPRVMKNRLPREVVFAQIPHLREQLFTTAIGIRQGLRAREHRTSTEARAGAVTIAEDPSVRLLAQFLDEDCLPYLIADRGDRLRLGDARVAAEIFRTVRVSVTAEWRSRVDEIEQWCNERRWMDVQTRLQHILHGWLLIHVPFSIALLVFTAWHAWVALRFVIVPM